GYRYHPLPTISEVTPPSGDPSGGTPIELTGSGFLTDDAGTNQITFRGVPATDVVVLSDTLLSCIAPPGVSRTTGDVVVANANGTAPLPGAFRWQPWLRTDLDQDGFADLAMGASEHDSGAGAVHVFFGSESGVSSTTAARSDLRITASAPGSGLGRVVHSDDVDGDRYPDLIIAAPEDDTAGTDAGAVYLFLGPLHPASEPIPAAAASAVLFGEAAGERFGSALETGDLDGDGVADLLAGASPADEAHPGAVYVFRGGRELLTGATASAWLVGDHGGDGFGSTLEVGDLDGDRDLDLLVGAPGSAQNGSSSGAVYIYRGGLAFPSPRVDSVLLGEASGHRFGTALSLGDVDGDGREDLLVGAAGAGRDLRGGGRVYVFRGGPELACCEASLADAILEADLDGSNLGASLAVADASGDGIADVLAGAPSFSPSRPRWSSSILPSDLRPQGRAYLFLGGAPFASRSTALADFVLEADPVSALFGSTLTIQDLDGDDIGDMVISSLDSEGSDEGSGRAHIFYGSSPLYQGALITGEPSKDGFASSHLRTR
ncbi:MAG: FG-GAP-like repeat-containing protein, partial [Actinobacteria bacterium]|nr:FG-GAP-like repeat-containing protein [Actinomycetota bacterium]